MTETKHRDVTGSRSGASRKLLARKAAEAGASAFEGDSVEESFPVHGAGEAELSAPEVAGPALPQGSAEAPTDHQRPAAAQTTEPTVSWSNEDEATLQALISRRKAAGFRGRGRDVSNQIIRAGDIKPNNNTVVSVIVGLVAERGELSRAQLIDAMASATFPHAKAQPGNRGWCQGYVAGAIRSGFLALAEDVPAAEADA